MQEYTKRKQEHAGREAGRLSQAEKAGSIPNSSMEAIMAGRARASSEMMGHRQDLAPSLNAKMAKAFGMDLSNMQIYRSEAMSGTETKGLASGNKIVLSKDVDLNTMAGQAILGHEISHVHAQSQGIGMGHSGLYQNAGLEHQADVEGMMAARGQSILGGDTGMDMGLGMGGIGGLTPLGVGMSASAGAPMQAKDKGKPKKRRRNPGPRGLRSGAPKKYKKKVQSAVNAAPAKEQLFSHTGEYEFDIARRVAEEMAEYMEDKTENKDKNRYLTRGFDENDYINAMNVDQSVQDKSNNKKKKKNKKKEEEPGYNKYKDYAQNNPVFKKMVQAEMQRRYQQNNYWKKTDRSNQDALNAWYNGKLMLGLETEYNGGDVCDTNVDYEKYREDLEKAGLTENFMEYAENMKNRKKRKHVL